MRGKTLWQMDGRDGRVFEAKRLLASLAIEMKMPLGMVTLALVVVAEFVVQNTAPVFERMHYIVVSKKCQHTEYTRFVEREHLVLHITQTHRSPQLHERLIDENAVDGGLDFLLFQ